MRLMAKATYDDANLILRLYELRREEKLRDARNWFAANCKASSMEELQKIAPMGSPENAYFRMLVSYWEMAASLVTSGALNQELFFQSNGEILFVWERIKDIAPGFREFLKNPNAWRNLETVANAYIKYMESGAPGSYAAVQGMVKNVGAAQQAAGR